MAAAVEFVWSGTVAKKKALAKISLAEMDIFNMSAMMHLAGRLFAPARTVVIVKRRVQIMFAEKRW